MVLYYIMHIALHIAFSSDSSNYNYMCVYKNSFLVIQYILNEFDVFVSVHSEMYDS